MNDLESITYERPNDPGSEFPERLERVIGSSSLRGFARKAGVSDTFLRQCLAGRTEPTRKKLIALATAGACSVEWLATGNAPTPAVAESALPSDAGAPVDLARLQTAIRMIEEILQDSGTALDAGYKAHLIASTYQHGSGNDPESFSRDWIADVIAGMK